MKAIIFLLVGLVLTLGCSKDDNPTAPQNHAPQISSVTAIPDSIAVSGSTTLNCTATDADGDSLHYVWLSLQGFFPNGVTSASVVWLAPATAGDYTIHVTVRDSAETTSGSKVVKVTTSQAIEQDFPLGNTGQTIRMCWIPAGSFQMGRVPGEQDSYDDEDPRHLVTFASGFWLSKFEITQAQWQAVMGSNPSYFRGDNFPVETVSWDDIQGFESALGGVFRLPSEAEWEYACRAGTTTRFYWGDDSSYSQIGSYAWYYDNSNNTTHSVGTKTANAWGLCDMSGNVWEWCEDWYHDSYTSAPNDGSAWVTGDGTYRVLRGGSWYLDSWFFRSAFRDGYGPAGRGTVGGFRVAADFPSP